MIKKTKLRLRKPFVIALPFFLLLTIVSTVIIIKNNHSYSATVEQKKETAPSIIEDNKDENNFLNTNEYLNNIDNFFKTVQKDNTVIYYASKFKFNEDKILEIVKKITNNYTKETYLKTNVIGSDAVINNLGTFNSFEAGVAYFMRDIYRNPKRYGTTYDEIIQSNEIETNQKGSDGIIHMSNGLTFEQYYGKIADLFGIDKSVALAMVYHESGRMNSGLAKNKNNIGGMRGNGGWMAFPTLEAGVIAHVLTVKSISEKNGFDISDPDGIYKFSGIYVHGSVNNPSEDWVNKVMWYKSKFDEKDVFTIE